ncbi:MAG: serpin family protein [Acidobacteriaceae bacterium]
MQKTRYFSRIVSLTLAALIALTACEASTLQPKQDTPQPSIQAPTPTHLPPAMVPTQPPAAKPAPVNLLHSNLNRDPSPIVSAADQSQLASDNLAFTMDLYHQLASRPGNLFYSPYSISQAMAMVYGGARGRTEQQMALGMHFSLPQVRLHPAFNALDLELASRAEAVKEGGQGFQLNIANATWGQSGFPFLSSYLDLLATNYGAGLQAVDFANNPEGARQEINDWVAKQTQDKIKDIVPEGDIDTLTRLVLANAIYFKASWMLPFQKSATQDTPFTMLDGSQVTVPMMSLDENKLSYQKGDDYQAVALPYVDGKVSMLLLVPDAGKFNQFQASLDASKLKSIMDNLLTNAVILKMPRFSVESSFSLGDTLANMGMPDAFTASQADFSGMDGLRDLYISSVIHKAYASVDEDGTEAAAATIAIMSLTGISQGEPVSLTIDRPFIFIIYDRPTQSILFAGRVTNPGE